MAIWKLSPINLNHPDWETSNYKGEIIVRSESEDRARIFISEKLRKAVCKPAGAEVQIVPWKQPALVSCIELKEESYSKIGMDEILDPEDARAYNNA